MKKVKENLGSVIGKAFAYLVVYVIVLPVIFLILFSLMEGEMNAIVIGRSIASTIGLGVSEFLCWSVGKVWAFVKSRTGK